MRRERGSCPAFQYLKNLRPDKLVRLRHVEREPRANPRATRAFCSTKKSATSLEKPQRTARTLSSPIVAPELRTALCVRAHDLAGQDPALQNRAHPAEGLDKVG